MSEPTPMADQLRFIRNLIVGSVVAVLIIGGLFFLASRSSDRRINRAIAQIKHDAKTSQQRDQAALVGVCGITNINRIGNQNMLTDINVNPPYDLGPGWPAFFDKWHAYWTPVECRALVPDELGVQLCLQYPPTNDPETGKPTPTTIDPINKTACDK